MANNWYIDYLNGSDTNDGQGPWKVAYTLGTGTQPVLAETITGAISLATAKVLKITGTWAVSGDLYVYNKVGTFQAETLNFSGGGACTIAGDFAISSVKTTDGITAAMSAPGDNFYLVKSTDPYSLGNATWTNDSETITLAAAQTANIETCETVWTSGDAVNIAVTVVSMTEGTYGNQFAVGANFITGIIAYKDITTSNWSTYQKVSFVIYASVAVVANTLRLDLCSDNVGATPVNSFTIPFKLEAARYYRFTFSPNAGAGNLGAAIESVALYALLDPGTTNIRIDNILACTTNGLNLQSLIGKNTGVPETFWTIKSINDTTVILGESQQIGTTVTKYYGTTELVATYNRETIKTTLAITSSTAVQTPKESGTAAAHMNYVGGYDITTNTRTGETWFDGTMGWGYGFGIGSIYYCNTSYLGFVRYSLGQNLFDNIEGIYETIHCVGNNSVGFSGNINAQYGMQANNIVCVQNMGTSSYGNFTFGTDGNILSNITLLSGYNGLVINTCSNNTISNLVCRGNTYNINKVVGARGRQNKILTGTLSNAVTSDFYMLGGGMEIFCENVEMLSTEVITSTSSGIYGSIITSQKHDKTAGLHKTWVWYNGNIVGAYYTIVIDTVIPGGGAFSTRVIPGNTTTQKTEATCLIEPMANAGNLTVSVDVRESVVGDGTDYNGGRIELVAKRNVAIGIAADTVIATATVASEGAFQTISGSLTGAGLTITDDGAVEFVIRCQGTAASTGWVNFKNVVVS